jgi:hypothetical protein
MVFRMEKNIRASAQVSGIVRPHHEARMTQHLAADFDGPLT